MTAFSYVTFTGDGVTTAYSFAGISEMFPNTFLTYASQLDVYVDGVLTTAWTVTDVVTKTLTFSVAPSNGSTIKIKRDTDKSARIHNFASGAIITANDLNHNNQQQFYIAQEIYDDLNGSLSQTPAGDKWDGEGKPTYNFAPAVDGNGLVTLNQVNAMLAGSLVGTFDDVDSFKFTGDGTTVNFDLTGVTRTGLTADAVLIQVNGVMQDPDVFSPSHTPKGAIGGGSPTYRAKKYTLNYTDFKSGSSYSPVISGGGNNISTLRLHEFDNNELAVGMYIRQPVDFTGATTTAELRWMSGATTYPSAFTHAGLTTTTRQYDDLLQTIAYPLDDGAPFIQLALTTLGAISALAAGQLEVTVIIQSTVNNVTSAGSTSGNANSNKYTISYVSGTPRVTFNTPPASGDVVVIRVMSGTFQGKIEDGSITTSMIADDAVTAAKLNVGAGSAGRMLTFDALGDASAVTPTASLISDFNTAVRTSRLDQMAVPTADVSINNNKLTNVATGTSGTDAVNKAQMDAAISATGVVIGRSAGVTIAANVATDFAYPGGFTTYPKAVAVRLMSASSIAYGAASGHTSDTVLFYTDGGATEARATSDINHATGTHTGVWIQVQGLTTGVRITHNSANFGFADIIWIK